jgi:YD repeat-containing protein
MKKKVITHFSIAGAALLLTGAVAVSTVDKLVIEPKVISSWPDLYSAFNARPSSPPLPDMAPEMIYKMIQAGDWSFMTNNWFRTESGGTFYVSKDSKELQKLKLPLTIRIYDYLPTGQTYILSSQDGEKFKSEASFVSESLTDDLFEELTEEEQTHDLLFALWRKRIVWEVTLKPEADAWNDLVSKESTLTASALSLDGGMMMMSVPEEHTNDLWLCLETQTNGINLNVFAPEGFTNLVEIYSCPDLVSNVWSIAEQNLMPSGTNPAVWEASGFEVHFYAAGNMDIDSDGDGLPDARERFVHKTAPDDADTDGDGMPDGWELQYGFNPLFYADGGFDFDLDGVSNADEYRYGTRPDVADTDGDGMPDGWEVAGALNPLVDDSVGDPDADGVNNLAEYTAGTHPQIYNVTLLSGAEGSLVFRYDDDGRLTEAHLNNASSELYSLTPAHNVNDLKVFVQ